MEDIIRTAVSPVYFKNARKWAHSIHKSDEKQYNLDKLEVMTLRTLRMRWAIWMIYCPYANIACDRSVSWVRRQGLLVTGSISIYQILQVSARESRLRSWERTSVQVPSQIAYNIAVAQHKAQQCRYSLTLYKAWVVIELVERSIAN